MKRTPAAGTPLGVRLAATFFLIGEAAPFAPATFGSAATLPFIFLYAGRPLWIQIAVLAVVTWIAVVVSGMAERHYGHDAKAIVVDEVAGMLVTFAGVPWLGHWQGNLLLCFYGFLLFRILDVVKPFPAGRAQDLPGGIGVVADDVMAGLYANLALRVLLRVFGGMGTGL